MIHICKTAFGSICAWANVAFLLSTCSGVAAAGVGHTTRDLEFDGDHPNCADVAEGKWTYQGNTLDGQ